MDGGGRLFRTCRYPVTLQVTDASGNVSETYRRYVVASMRCSWTGFITISTITGREFYQTDGQEVKSRFVFAPGKTLFRLPKKKALLISDSPKRSGATGSCIRTK